MSESKEDRLQQHVKQQFKRLLRRMDRTSAHLVCPSDQDLEAVCPRCGPIHRVRRYQKLLAYGQRGRDVLVCPSCDSVVKTAEAAKRLPPRVKRAFAAAERALGRKVVDEIRAQHKQ